jgi:hypothetical protein
VDPNPAATFINQWFYTRDKTFEVPPKQDIPIIKDTSHSFSGWCDEPELRPLILLSQQNYEDPEKWNKEKRLRNRMVFLILFTAVIATVIYVNNR